MTSVEIGMLGLVGLLTLIMLRMPVGVVMILVGGVGYSIIAGITPAQSVLANYPFQHASSYSLSVIPLFVLMGQLAVQSGISRDLFAATYAWIGSFRGGLASATVASSAGFAALSGSSVASAATMGSVALPEMDRYKYDTALATGTVAAGGTLGILIPPSTGFILYALLTEESIGQLFMAGVIPGIMLALLFILVIWVQTKYRPELGPPGPKSNWRWKWVSLLRASPMLLIVTLVIGGIYAGAFTPNEAAGIGAFLTLIAALLKRTMGWRDFMITILETVKISGMVLFVVIGAYLFNPFLGLTRIPGELGIFLGSLDIPPMVIFLCVLASLIVLGTFLEGLAILVMAIPIVFPIIVGLGYDPIWFGVMVVVTLEMGLISPPLGVIVFVVRGVATSVLKRDVPLATVFKGILPFWLAMFVLMMLLLIFPELVLYLPNQMYN
ncbi:TRAP transporter large permease [Marinobacter sp. ATCH36]|uniref:TRAP transporter large permease n=1 Tax=Marinobacter sp. ATCH36 TaxID=2945106 RepID=UPI0020209A91|nr:TRAP transporter large permease [Marinobacter sp. ATCH36]MCL7942946.1 TRAP transporter large permease [Marinobacter sp. ATCH36]